MTRNNTSKSLPAAPLCVEPDESKKSLDIERSFDQGRACTRMKLTDPQKKVKHVPNGLCSFQQSAVILNPRGIG
jgi:hypothetical protein